MFSRTILLTPRGGHFLFAAALLTTLLVTPVTAQVVSSVSLRPFVTALIPVIGRNGAIGGVMVNAAGVVRRAESSDSASLRRAWSRARMPLPDELSRETGLRMVSLRRLEATLTRHLKDKTPFPNEIMFLAGLHRVEYVFVVPDRRDIVLAGPADAWRLGAEAAMVAEGTKTPVLRLDDLMDALRTVEVAETGPGISCSIDPTREGLLQLKRLLSSRKLRLSAATIQRMRQAVGDQQVTITGVAPDSHFARVMLAADFQMKTLAMDLQEAPVARFPSYLELLGATSRQSPQIAAPRWWLAADYEPLLRSPDGRAWQLRGPGVQAMTEDGHLIEAGEIVAATRKNHLAESWANALSERYAELGESLTAFAALRNCMDLAVVAALIAKEDMLTEAGCELPHLLSAAHIRGPRYNVPKTIESQVSLTRSSRGWFVSISGGVEIDSWSVLRQVETSETLLPVRQAALKSDSLNWWWD